MTVSAQVWIDPAMQAPFSLWHLGDALKDLSRGNWHTVTCTLSNRTVGVFDNGVELVRLDGGTVDLRELGKAFQGKMRRLTVWNRALTAQEILASR